MRVTLSARDSPCLADFSVSTFVLKTGSETDQKRTTFLTKIFLVSNSQLFIIGASGQRLDGVSNKVKKEKNEKLHLFIKNGGFACRLVPGHHFRFCQCAIRFAYSRRTRVISAQKANTANAFSLPTLALSTANLYTAVQPGGTLFGLQHSNPVDADAAYKGPSEHYGRQNDPLVGKKIGGINVFGGGLALYNSEGKLLGALGVSGDSSCADHIIAWKIRHALNLDNVPAGVSPTGDDNMVHDIAEDAHGHPKSAGGWGHPVCSAAEAAIVAALPATHPVGPNP